jgi:GTP-binding protein LepA
MFDVAVQAAVGSHIIARNHQALRKNVLAKCYGSDITRKKSCSKQRQAKRMKQVGAVEIRRRPSSPFCRSQ